LEWNTVTIAKTLCASLPIIILAGLAQAQEAGTMRNTFYIGGGKTTTTDSFANQDTPFSLGYMHQVEDRKAIFGFDLAGEGTSLDSTWGMTNEPVQAMSFNFLFGSNVIDDGRIRADAALLIGLRESAADCPDSFLGYQCYADSDPIVEYQANFGAVVNVSFDKLSVGLRATGESTQLLLGMRF
jgi:hypothetical protein